MKSRGLTVVLLVLIALTFGLAAPQALREALERGVSRALTNRAALLRA
jgi:hypothetical protein